MDNNSKFLLGCTGILLLMVFSTIFNAAVLAILWEWFVVPIFDVPPLSIPIAIGLTCIVNYLFYYQDYAKEKDVDWKQKIALMFMRPCIYLGIGYIVHIFI